jgi:hypothetical protein
LVEIDKNEEGTIFAPSPFLLRLTFCPALTLMDHPARPKTKIKIPRPRPAYFSDRRSYFF